MRLKVEEIKRYIERFFEILILIKDAILDSGGGGDTFNQNIITKNWQPMTTFRKGEYVLHNNQMWECLIDNINQVPVDGTYWKNTNVANEFYAVNNNLNQKIIKDTTDITDQTTSVNGALTFIKPDDPTRFWYAVEVDNAKNSSGTSCVAYIFHTDGAIFYEYGTNNIVKSNKLSSGKVTWLGVKL